MHVKKNLLLKIKKTCCSVVVDVGRGAKTNKFWQSSGDFKHQTTTSKNDSNCFPTTTLSVTEKLLPQSPAGAAAGASRSEAPPNAPRGQGIPAPPSPHPQRLGSVSLRSPNCRKMPRQADLGRRGSTCFVACNTNSGLSWRTELPGIPIEKHGKCD